jgi:hypothetical protein
MKVLRSSGEEVVVAGFRRDYWNQDHSHHPYAGLLHDDNDKLLDWRGLVETALAEIREGAVVEIIVRRTGKVDTRADRPWCLVRPHHYGPCPEHEEAP